MDNQEWLRMTWELFQMFSFNSSHKALWCLPQKRLRQKFDKFHFADNFAAQQLTQEDNPQKFRCSADCCQDWGNIDASASANQIPSYFLASLLLVFLWSGQTGVPQWNTNTKVPSLCGQYFRIFLMSWHSQKVSELKILNKKGKEINVNIWRNSNVWWGDVCRWARPRKHEHNLQRFGPSTSTYPRDLFLRYFRYFNLNLSQGSFSNILGGQRPPYPHKHDPAQSGECPVTHVRRASTRQFRDSLEGDLKNKIFDLFWQ